jgi:glycosyltransferase involved in cell wall biosynthesis
VSNVLLVTHETLGESLAGPGMRYWEFANTLGAEHRVTLLAPRAAGVRHPRAEGSDLNASTFRRMARQADLVISQGFGGYGAPEIAFLDTPQVFDLYCPIPFESLEFYRSQPDHALGPSHLEHIRSRLSLLLRRGDFFLCASEEQRHFWLGALYAVGRISLVDYAANARLTNLIAVVPMGVPGELPRASGHQLRRAHPAITDEDFLLLSFGGLWDWLDPFTLIRAMARLAPTLPTVKLLFVTGSPPPPGASRKTLLADAIAESQRLGVYDKQVFFHSLPVPYTERDRYLAEADVGVALYREGLETEFAFRTRLLDYFWTGLPILCTRGDSLSRLVERHAAGLAVTPQSVEQVESAVRQLAVDASFRERCREGSRQIATELAWPNVVRPLDEFCRSPRRAPGIHSLSAKTSALTRYLLANARTLLSHPTPSVIRQAAGKLRQDFLSPG